MNHLTLNIAIRVDASEAIGTGHFMRCLTLAEMLKPGSSNIRFICRYLPIALREMLEAKGFTFAILESDQHSQACDELPHSKWLGVGQLEDASDTRNAITDESWSWLIVDHYALDYRWESSMLESVNHIMVIDDIADRRHSCSILLDQNYYSDMESRYLGKVPEDCQLLLGPDFALLRNEFRLIANKVKPRKGKVKRILIAMGGVDADNLTAKIIESLKNIDLEGIRVDVVIGAIHPRLKQIASSCKELGYFCHIQTDQIARLMLTADMAIGAGGFSIWERCFMGLPSLTMVVANNQTRAVDDLDKCGVLINLGIAGKVSVKEMAETIRAFIANEGLRYSMSTACLNLMPGLEPFNFANAMDAYHDHIPKLQDSTNRIQ